MARRSRRDSDSDDTDRKSRVRGDYWHTAKPTETGKPPDVHALVYEHARWLQARDNVHRLKCRIHEALYENTPLSPGGEYAQALSLLRAKGFRPSRLNVARSIVDTWTAKLSKRRPMIAVTPDDAEWSYRLRAQQLTKFIRAKTRETDFERTRREILKDTGIDGNGIISVGKEFGEIVAERVYREEVLVDPREARYGKPRNFYRVRRAPKDVITELVAEAYKGSSVAQEMIAIVRAAPESEPRRDAFGYDDGEYTSDGRIANQVDVYEAWHLPASPDSDDGRYAMCLCNGTLFLDPWKRPRPPMAFLRRSVPKKKFWGVGLVEHIAEQQHQINQTVRAIQENLYYGSTLRVFVPRNSEIIKSHLAGRHPHYVEYDPAMGPSGGKPEYVVPDAISPQQVAWLEKQIQMAYDLSGVSMMSAASKNPLGANASGVALDNFYDIESERFAMEEAAYVDFTLDACELYIDTAKEIAEERKNGNPKRPYAAVWIDKTHTERIDWDKVDMSRDQFKLVPEPVNFVPSTRAGKLAAVEQLTKAGIFDSHDAAHLFEEPDVARAFRLKNALRNNLERCGEVLADPDKDLAEHGVYVDEHMLVEEPGLARKLALAWYNDAQANRAPEAVLQRYRDWLVQIQMVEEQIASKAAQAAPPAPTPSGMPGPGAPMPADPMAPPAVDPMAAMAAAGQPMPLPPSPVPGAPPVAPIIQ